MSDDLSIGASAPVSAPESTVEAAPNGFATLGLRPELLAAVADLGYSQPTQVQQEVIPFATVTLEAKGDDQTIRYADLMVSSQTGSGKTAAFLLPVLHTLIEQKDEQRAAELAAIEKLKAEALARGEDAPRKPKRKNPTSPRHFKPAVPGALVLCPTRELAQQVAHDAIGLVSHCKGLRIASVVGGMPYNVQIARLQNADLVVATPGRLLDLQRSNQIDLSEVQFLVVDEADRMLDLGFSDDLAEINQLTSQRRQTLMFSATFAPRIQQLAMRVMHEGGQHVRRVQIDSPQERHANIEQALYWADHPEHKRQLLDHWLRDSSIDQAIVFASTQIECDALATDLQQAGFHAVALHGALSQGLRNRRLMALRNGQVQFLVATDVAARGIDVPTITHVFNFGLPMKAEDYTHRIGRTGRAGRSGMAVTFAEFRDRRRVFDIEGYTRQRFEERTVEGLEPRQRPPRQEENRRGAGAGGRRRPGGGNGGGWNAGGKSGWGNNGRFGQTESRGGFGGGDRPARDVRRDSRFGDQAPRGEARPQGDWGGRSSQNDRRPAARGDAPHWGGHRDADNRGRRDAAPRGNAGGNNSGRGDRGSWGSQHPAGGRGSNGNGRREREGGFSRGGDRDVRFR